MPITDTNVHRGVLVVIPAYNEHDCIAAVVDEVRGAGFDCLVVDDASRDDTADIARAHGAAVVQLPINLGVGGALRTGFRYAVDHDCTTVVQVDADGQHVADHIRHLLAALDEQSLDMVVGSRFAGDNGYRMTFVRRLCVRVLSSVIRRTGKARISDPTSGFAPSATPCSARSRPTSLPTTSVTRSKPCWWPRAAATGWERSPSRCASAKAADRRQISTRSSKRCCGRARCCSPGPRSTCR